MKRREFLGLIGSGTALWPLSARAEGPSMPAVGFLSSLSPQELSFVLPAFHQGLGEAGFGEGRNITIEYRWAEGHYERLPSLAADLVRRQVAVIAAISGTPAALAAKAATTTIPIVFAIGGDPVAPGLVTNLSRPEGNVTGTSFFTSPVVTKRLELANELSGGRTIGVLVNPGNPPSVTEGKSLQAAAERLGRAIAIANVSTEVQIDGAFADITQREIGALIVSSDPLFFIARKRLIMLTTRQGLPTVFADREQVEAGGLISYGASRPEAYRLAGAYIGRILKGEKPGDLPVVLPTKFELIVNLKTAAAMGLALPPSLLARADEVIE
jgi:putative tryptophan/tyrosine transport system substrate-binding protein